MMHASNLRWLPGARAPVLVTLALGLALPLAASSCVLPPPSGGDDGSTGSSGAGSTGATEPTAGSGVTTEPTAGSDPTTEPTADSGSTAGPTGPADSTGDTGVTGPCPDVPGFECSMPIDCEGRPCGDVLSPVDAEGCMKPPCVVPDDCDQAQLCFLPYEEYGVCVSSGIACSDGPTGACECVSTPDCSGGYCITDCIAQPDEASCLAADCSHMTVVELSETCECTDTPLCFQSPAGIGGVPSYLWHVETLRVAYFGPRPWQIPIGWRSCSDPGAPPACGCNDPDAPPMCP